MKFDGFFEVIQTGANIKFQWCERGFHQSLIINFNEAFRTEVYNFQQEKFIYDERKNILQVKSETDRNILRSEHVDNPSWKTF